MITKKAEYAIIALADLASLQFGRKTTTREIVERRDIPANLVAQLLSTMRDAGWVKSIRGAKGGVYLLKNPEQITMKDVIELIDGPVNITRCLLQSMPCGNKLSCPLRDVWKKAQKEMLTVFEKTTIKDLAEKID
ncbi:MAG: Rrf2 family transcriptional regulator [Firmicutes bacterium]|nr:Rrf2 family transcriptional regulator [Bacillota bacterium]